MKIAFASFGCKVNQAEIDSMIARLPEYGCSYAADIGQADILVVNTCAVTEKAQKDGERYLFRAKKDNPSLIIAATGCLAELLKNKLATDIVVLNSEKGDLLSMLPKSGVIDKQPNPRLHTRSFIKIQDGCDACCTYCIIPSLRGEPQSKRTEEAISDIKAALEAESKEIVLTGIHIGLYGKDLDDISLTGLLEKILNIDGDFRVRLSSLYVNEIDDVLIGIIKNSNGRICPHFHISLQSGSTAILKKMGRKYTPDSFTEAVNKIYTHIPDASIGVDVITGFPGETEMLYKETKELLTKTNIAYLHVFPFSARPNTPAAKFEGQIPTEVKQARAKDLRELAALHKSRSAEAMIGRNVRVLTEKDGKGHTDNFFLVELPENQPVNEFVYITIQGVRKDGTLY